MSLITPQRLVTEQLPAGHVLTLTLLQGSGAIVQRSCAGQVVASGPMTATSTYGPYLQDMSISVSCLAGSLVESSVAADTGAGLSAAERVSAQALVAGYGIATPPADSLLSKYGRQVADICSATTTIGVTTMTHVLSNERTRFSTYTRKCTPSANTLSELRFPNLSMTLDPDDQSLTIPVYIDAPIWEFTAFGALPFIAINLSTGGGSLGANYDQWVFGANYLRQGWNLLKMRQADTVGAATSGNNAFGCGRIRNGTGVSLASTITYMSIQMTNMSGINVHIDNPRRSAMAKPLLVMGFDASGSAADDDIFPAKVAPLFAQHGAVGYVTYTHIYEAISAGSQSWARISALQNQYGWGVLNHTWSHGATEVGRGDITVTITWTAGTLATVTYPAAHNITIGKRYKTRIVGATPASFNGVQEMTATTTTQATFVTAEATGGTATGTIKLFQYLADVFNTDTTENRRLLGHELADTAKIMRGSGMAKAAHILAYPNNSVPELGLLQAVSAEAGIAFGRSTRGGFVFVDEFGVDNPLHFGSFVWDSGAFATTTSFIIAKVDAAVERGEHIWLYGHYIQDEATAGGPVDLEYAPGAGGNPAPPGGSLSGTGGWWYLGQLKRLFNECIGPHIAAGRLEPVSAAEWAYRLGYGVGK